MSRARIATVHVHRLPVDVYYHADTLDRGACNIMRRAIRASYRDARTRLRLDPDDARAWVVGTLASLPNVTVRGTYGR